jgi:hypothetical protein
MTGIQTVNSPAKRLLMPLMHVMQKMMAIVRLFETERSDSVSSVDSDNLMVMAEGRFGAASSSRLEPACKDDIIDDVLLMHV